MIISGILAPNPGPMTLDGTNTWIIGDPADGAPAVVDAGPLDEGHLSAVLDACGGRISTILLTHRHHDHSDGLARLAELANCPVRAADPQFQIGPAGLADGDAIAIGRATLTAVATPGHTSDSFSFLLDGDDGVNRLLTGDMVLGRGTTVIMHPDGDLGQYFDSLERMLALVERYQIAEILPGHGPVVTQPAETLTFYRQHRRDRLKQVRRAMTEGATTAGQVVESVYADVDHDLWPAAEQSVAAQLHYLEANS